MTNYELMAIWRTKKIVSNKSIGPFEVSIVHDYDASLPTYGDTDMVDSESVALGSPMDIVKYILKEDLKNYKLVKKSKSTLTKRKVKKR